MTNLERAAELLRQAHDILVPVAALPIHEGVRQSAACGHIHAALLLIGQRT